MRLIVPIALAALAVAAPAAARQHDRHHVPTRAEADRRNEQNGLHRYYGGYGDGDMAASAEPHGPPPPRMHGPRDHGPLNRDRRDAKPFDNAAPTA